MRPRLAQNVRANGNVVSSTRGRHTMRALRAASEKIPIPQQTGTAQRTIPAPAAGSSPPLHPSQSKSCRARHAGAIPASAASRGVYAHRPCSYRPSDNLESHPSLLQTPLDSATLAASADVLACPSSANGTLDRQSPTCRPAALRPPHASSFSLALAKEVAARLSPSSAPDSEKRSSPCRTRKAIACNLKS